MNHSQIYDNKTKIIIFLFLFLCLTGVGVLYTPFGHWIVSSQSKFLQDYYLRIEDQLRIYSSGVCIFGLYILFFNFISNKLGLFVKLDLYSGQLIDKLLKHKFLVAILFAILLIFSKVPLLNLPAFWDEGSYFKIASNIYKNGFDSATMSWSCRPPFLFIITALAYKLFNPSIITAHSVILIFSFILLYFTYLLGEKLYSKEIGLFASLLLFFSPIFFAQSGLFLLDIPVAALTAVTLYFLIGNRKLAYFFAGSFLVLTKETAVLIIISIGIYEFFLSLLELYRFGKNYPLFYKIKAIILNVLFVISPLIFFFVLMIINQIFLNYPLGINLSYIFNTSALPFHKIGEVINSVFLIHFRYLITTVLLVGMLFYLFVREFRKRILRKELLLFGILLLTNLFSFLFAFRLFCGPLPRYFIFLLPLFFIFATASLSQLIKNRFVNIITVMIIIGLFSSSWFTNDIRYAHELNLDYLSKINVHKQVAKFLEENFSSFSIVTTWPIIEQLTMPELGYVKEPLRGFDVRQIKKLKAEKNIIVVVSEYNVNWQKATKDLLKFVQDNKGKLLTRFKNSQEEVLIYSVQLD